MVLGGVMWCYGCYLVLCGLCADVWWYLVLCGAMWRYVAFCGVVLRYVMLCDVM